MTDHAILMRLTEAYDLAARRHAGQSRKGAASEPYVNHVADVARRVARSPQATDAVVLAAVLHDTVEDTDTALAEIETIFGAEVAGYVAEVTDDKSLPKEERKRRQIAEAPSKSDGAKRIKLADKASNLESLISSPPHFWDITRKREYLAWARAVVAGLRGVDEQLERDFDDVAARAEQVLLTE